MALIIAAIVKAEATGRLRVAWPLILLGNASYAIYLVHFPLMSATISRLRDLGVSWVAALSALILLSTLAGLAYHLLYEAPALRAAKGWISGRIGSGPRRAPVRPRGVEEPDGGQGA
jgi:peptidoglycan/LPS O-acetylase OafA/YrhL